MVERLGDVRSLEKSTPEIMLASTLPLDSIHTAMFKMLKKRWGDGPQPLDSAGWGDRAMIDPGLVVVLKLPRSKTAKTPSLTAPRSGRYTSRRPTGPDAGYATGAQPSKSDLALKKEQIETEWMMTLSKMVESWCTRLDAASQAQKRAARRGQKLAETQPTRLDEFDIQDAKDFKEAKITAAYQLNWPEKAPEGLGKVKPGCFKIQYFHLQLPGMPKKTMNTFKRLAKGGEIHEMNNGLWLDLVKSTSQPNNKRSLDILVTSADKQPVDLTTPKEETIDLEANILAIEIADPSKE